MSGDYQLGDTVYLPFSTRAITGVPTALVSGEVQIYEDASVTQITAAETLSVSLDGIAGFNMVAVAATGGNGFGTGQSYTAILSAGTVNSVSAIGEVVGHFTLEASAAALDLANGTDGLTALAADIAAAQTDLDTLTAGVTLAAGAITNASLAGNMEIVFETDFATNYNTTRNAWATNAQDFVGTTAADPFNGQLATPTNITAATGVVLSAVTHTGAVIPTVSALTGHTAQTGDSYARIGAAGASLTAINLPNQTMDITGNLSGSVGSVTGAVGSVTGAVGSVTGAVGSVAGNVDGNVSGSVASNLELGPSEVNAQCDASIETYRLDELFNVALGSQPTAGSFLADLSEDNGGTQRFTAAALSEAPSGTGGDATEAKQDEILVDLADIKGTGFTKDVESLTDIFAASGGSTPAAIADAVWNEDATAHQTTGTFGQAIGDPGANTETMYDAVVTDAAGTNVSADVVAVKAETALIVADTGELQTNQGNWLTITGHATEAKQDIMDTNIDQIETAVITNAAGVDIAADIIAVKAETALIVGDTGELQTNQGNWLTITGHATEAKQDIIDTNVDQIESAVITNAAGVDIAADIIAVKAETALIVEDTGTTLPGRFDTVDTDTGNIEADTQDLQTQIGTAGAGLLDLGGMSTAMLAEVNGEIVDVMKTDPIAERTNGAPTATPTFEEAISYLYMMLTNKIDIDDGFKEFYNNGGTIIWKKALSDDASNYIEANGQSGS